MFFSPLVSHANKPGLISRCGFLNNQSSKPGKELPSKPDKLLGSSSGLSLVSTNVLQ